MNGIKFSNKRESSLIEKFGNDWYFKLYSFLWSTEYDEIRNFLISRSKQNKIIIPEPDLLFNCFKLTPWDKLKIVILGKEPYANMENNKIVCDGLAYSYNSNSNTITNRPNDITNIIKAIDLNMCQGFPAFPGRDTNLKDLAEQGVLLLNDALTCELNYSSAHKDVWNPFILNVINVINEYNSGIIFMLWGDTGKKYKNSINNKHYILEAGDPAKGGDEWFKNDNFYKANKILNENNGPEFQILWTNNIF